MNKTIKRIISMVLCFVMVLGFVPANVFAATGDVIDAAIFCSDVHGNPSSVTSIFNGIKNADSTFNPTTASFVGDTQTTASSVTSAAQSVYSNVQCIYAFGNHDDENGNTSIPDFTGLSYGDSTTNYYIYTISESSMGSSNPDTTDFTNTVAGLDKSKPLFIISHLPLHSRRGDSNGAAVWYPAISAAAEKMDIFFFWAHNHTSEGSADTAAYYVAKNGSETITLENTSTVVTPNFTYANAGYINPPNKPARNNVATAVRIYDDSVNLTVYNASGELSGTYAVNETVTREFAGSVAAPVLESIAVSGDTVYYVGDELNLTVTATYDNDTSVDVTSKATFDNDLSASGAYTVTASYTEGDVTKTASTDVEVYIYAEDEISLISVEVFSQGATGLTVTWDEDAESYLNTVMDDYVVYDLALTNAGTTAEYAMSIVEDMDTSKLVVYHVAEDGTLTKMDAAIEGDCVVFTTSLTGTFAYGSVSVPDGYELDSLEVTNPQADYLVGQNLSLTGDFTIKAVYTKDGAEDFVRTLYAYEANNNPDGYEINMDSFDMTAAGSYNVEITYGGKSVTFPITVWGNTFAAGDVTVALDGEGAEYGVTGATVNESTNANVESAVADLMESGSYKAYDISLTYAENYAATEDTKTVTLPIPEGVNNPVVYYVSEDGTTVTNMNAVKGDGVVTFTTTHFSTYVVGESTEITVPDPETATGSGSTTTTTKKTVYVLTSSISSGNEYLIVNGNSAGSYYALANNNGSVAATGVTVKTDSEIGTYIELDDATDELWTVSNSYRFQNGNYYLGYTTSGNNWNQSYTFGLSTTARTWSYSNNRLSTSVGDWNSTTYYLRYNSGWTWTNSSSASGRSVYFYIPTEVEVETTTTVSGTYSIAGEDLTIGVDSKKSANLTSTLAFVPTSGTATETDVSTEATYTVVDGGDPNGVIAGISGNTVTFSGNYGKALVKVSYTTSFGEVTNYITITAVEAVYTLDLCEAVTTDGTTTYESITKTVVIKGVEAGDTYPLWAVITKDGEDMGSLTEEDLAKLTFVSSNPAVATVDSTTGIVTFTGKKGAVQITAYYEYADGKSVTDTVTFSVSEDNYYVPEDATDDFPKYPEQGAIRFDKTAVAQGNFSETGIAKVELSMTGVPYGTSTKTDVVIMVDMTASMSDNDVTAAELAVKELIKSLVYDEENDKYDSNIQLFIDVFYSASQDSSFSTENYLNGTTISSASELTAAQNEIDFTQSSNGGGTRYNLAMKDVYETLNREGHADNQFVVFVSDGVPTAYAPASTDTNGNVTLGTTITGSNSETSSLADGWFDLETGAVTSDFETEYYSYMIKTAGIPMYTVGCNLTELTEPALVLDHMSSNYSPDGKTATGETKYSFFCTTSGGITDEVLKIFKGIGQDIKEAATNVVVEDKIDSRYTVNFSLPSGVTADEAGMDDFYIQVLGYELDENNERKANPTVLEKFLFNDDGTITHTIGSTTCESCAHVTMTDGVVTAIDGTYFDYTTKKVTNEDGETVTEEYLTWTADKLDRTELALEYFVYLDNSAGDVAAADQVAAGTYPTNEYATITYKNHLGNDCKQYFPVPSMTWKGAKVTYVFYLVNNDGQPVSRAGKVIPFAEAVYVTTPVTFDVHWNETAGSENILAKDIFATAGVPDVYELYDNTANYVIRVYQTENVDSEGVNGNYFEIIGANDKLIDSAMDTDTYVDNSTTKVFNTKAGKKYDKYGAYSVYEVGTKLTNGSETITTDFKAADIDYANTTVAFAVVWTPALAEDAVVVDFGLDVIIDVTTNDGMAAGVVGVRAEAPSGVTMNSGTYTAADVTSITSADGLWTASVENLTSVRFHMNEMGISAPAEFYYEADVNYYTYANNTETLNTTSMYSKVTVIPATTIYYEDDFLDFTSYTNNVLDETCKWVTEAQSGEQQQDRPGASKISADLDADNNYGYDSAYEEMATHSMGSAAKITVDANTRGEATFTFWGTGFDVISTTSNTTGTITVKVMDAKGNVVKNTVVDTYYGYTRNTDGEWVITNETANALYQVPVIKIFGLTYGQYTVKITAGYNDFFNHTAAESSYDLYLDAIRIYDPTGDKNDVANDAYIADGEAYPEYFEVRDQIISKSTYDSLNDETVSGIVFIDGAVNGPSIEDYTSYGPNNEVYLTNGQAIAFDLNGTYTVPAGMELAKIQLAVKTTGSNGHVEVYGVKNDTKVSCLDETISTATDMYYDITALEGMTVVIKSTGAAIVSITNVKVTYQPEKTDALATTSVEETEAPMLFSISRASADAALVTLCAEKPAEPTDPETEPTDPETEPTDPETEPTDPETEPTEPETEPTEPEENPDYDEIKKAVEKTIRKIVKKLFGWLFG